MISDDLLRYKKIYIVGLALTVVVIIAGVLVYTGRAPAPANVTSNSVAAENVYVNNIVIRSVYSGTYSIPVQNSNSIGRTELPINGNLTSTFNSLAANGAVRLANVSGTWQSNLTTHTSFSTSVGGNYDYQIATLVPQGYALVSVKPLTNGFGFNVSPALPIAYNTNGIAVNLNISISTPDTPYNGGLTIGIFFNRTQ